MLVEQGLARRVLGKSLHEHFASVVSASGHDLGYIGDLQIDLYPVGENGCPSRVAFPIMVHIVSEYQGRGILIGTQQRQKWGLVTSYQTGMKTITTSGGTEFTYPFSVARDGTLLCPVKSTVGQEGSAGETHSVNGNDLHSCIAEAAQVVVSGEPGAFSSAWLEATPNVPLADNSAELQHHDQLKEELLKAAEVVANGGPNKETVAKYLRGAAALHSNVKKKVRVNEPPDKPRSTERRALPKWASCTLLAASVWTAALALTVGGVIPSWPHSWDYAAPQSRHLEDNATNPPWGSGTKRSQWI
jgi:hypothetical protein